MPKTRFVPSFSVKYSKKCNNLKLTIFMKINKYKINAENKKNNITFKLNFFIKFDIKYNNTAYKPICKNSLFLDWILV